MFYSYLKLYFVYSNLEASASRFDEYSKAS